MTGPAGHCRRATAACASRKGVRVSFPLRTPTAPAAGAMSSGGLGRASGAHGINLQASVPHGEPGRQLGTFHRDTPKACRSCGAFTRGKCSVRSWQEARRAKCPYIDRGPMEWGKTSLHAMTHRALRGRVGKPVSSSESAGTCGESVHGLPQTRCATAVGYKPARTGVVARSARAGWTGTHTLGGECSDKDRQGGTRRRSQRAGTHQAVLPLPTTNIGGTTP